MRTLLAATDPGPRCGRLPAFDARLLAQTAAAVLTTSFAQWGADDDPAQLPRWVAAGFDAVGSGFTA